LGLWGCGESPAHQLLQLQLLLQMSRLLLTCLEALTDLSAEILPSSHFHTK
jgi:hypothetical protein